jgi:hypothetical protein
MKDKNIKILRFIIICLSIILIFSITFSNGFQLVKNILINNIGVIGQIAYYFILEGFIFFIVGFAYALSSLFGDTTEEKEIEQAIKLIKLKYKKERIKNE